MWHYYNPNPRGKSVGDCTIRAISRATGKTWEETFIELALQAYIMGDMPSSNAVTTRYLLSDGFVLTPLPESCSADCYTASDFCADHPTGIYILCTGSHILTVIDGVIYDSWDSSNVVPVYFFQKRGE